MRTKFRVCSSSRAFYRTRTTSPRSLTLWVAQVQHAVPLWRLSNTHLNSCALVVEGVCVRSLPHLPVIMSDRGSGGRSGAQQLASHLHSRTRTSIGDHRAPSFSVSMQWHFTNNLFVRSCFATSFWRFVVEIIYIQNSKDRDILENANKVSYACTS